MGLEGRLRFRVGNSSDSLHVLTNLPLVRSQFSRRIGLNLMYAVVLQCPGFGYPGLCDSDEKFSVTVREEEMEEREGELGGERDGGPEKDRVDIGD